MELLTGKEIGGCRILDKLGEGGMGVAYKAHHLRLDRMVVAKFLFPQVASVPGQVESFLAEARAAAKLEHPRIVQVYDQGSTGPLHYIIMQFVDGETLDDLMQRAGQMPLLRAVQIIKAALEGLAEAHKHGIVHRDIKPSNILLGKDGSIRLGDFGLALKMTAAGKAQQGQIIGTPLYMSPEQIWGMEVDGRTDIYSMGATLFHMVAGQPPFSGPDAQTIVQMHVNNPLPDLRQLVPGVSKAMVELIAKMMAKAADDRFPRAEEALLALNSPAVLLEDATLAGERQIDLGVVPRSTKSTLRTGPTPMPQPGMIPVPTPGGAGVAAPIAAGDAVEVEPEGFRTLSQPPPAAGPSLVGKLRTPLALLLWAGAAAACHWAGANAQPLAAGVAGALGLAALALAPRGAKAMPLACLAAGGYLLYAAGVGTALAASPAAPNDLRLLAGGLLAAAAMACALEIPEGRSYLAGFLLFYVAMAACLLVFALPPELTPEKLLADPNARHPKAVSLLLGGVLSLMLVPMMNGSTAGFAPTAVLVLGGGTAIYAAGALHHKPPPPPPEPVTAVRPAPRPAPRPARRARSEGGSRLVVVIEDGETVVKEAPPEPEPSPESPAPAPEQPAPKDELPPFTWQDALRAPLQGVPGRLQRSGKLLPAGAALYALGLLLFWRSTRRPT